MIRLTKIFHFETAHALYGYDGKCSQVHGHSYKLYVTISGKPLKNPLHPKNGMVMDFGDLKKIVSEEIVKEFDHAILLEKDTPYQEMGEYLINQKHKVVWMDSTPTCENMLYYIAEKIQKRLPEGVVLEKLQLYETENSYGEWLRSDQQ